ncbi:MAG: T9SS type A sorting domain-containing protein [Candidatus Kapabacteria bacterium]|nr:T9SS type A sorting domain-containing protein [Candidatus Kapabacteria bacterium]
MVFHKNYIFALNSNGEIYRKKYRNFSTDVDIEQDKMLINYSNNIIRINEYIDSLMIYNILGELVFESKEVNIGEIQLGLNSGIYLVKANNQIYKIIVL